MAAGSTSEMIDVVRVMIALAAQWRVWRAIGPAAIPLLGVPVAAPARRKLQVAAPALARRGPGTGKNMKDTA